MNEELQKALTEILNKTIETTGKATDFMMAEIPDVVQQLLMWKMVEGIVYAFIGIILFIVVSFGAKKAVDYMREEDEWEYMPLMLIGSVAYIPSFILINLDWLQIWIAPKVYLLEYAANMVTK